MTTQDTENQNTGGEKIAKVLARRGVASRRQAERLVEDGRIRVDGELVSRPAVRIAADATITLDGKPVAAEKTTRLWRYHKPRGVITSDRDPEGRPTVFEQLPKEMGRVISVGRLDLDSEGLLLLTNDGEMARWMEHPDTGWKRRYRARVYGAIPPGIVKRLAEGMEVEGVRYRPIALTIDRKQGTNSWLSITLTEGKNREIRQVLRALDLRVNRLIRMTFGPFQLRDLEAGKAASVPARVLRDQLGRRLGPDGHFSPAKRP